MKRLALILAAAASLAACSPTVTDSVGRIPTAPAVAANATVLDEQVGATVELAYKAFRIALETATDAGLIRGERARQAAALDARAYALTQAVQAAYRAGNASGYVAAALEARRAIEQALLIVKRN